MIEKIELSIWDRVFELPINYNCYEGEQVSEEQIILLDLFIHHPEWIVKSKREVESYCRESVIADESNHKKDNIFSYIKPECIFVKNVKKPRLAIICKYRYDEEHGLAIEFDELGNIIVGPEDIIL